MVVDLQTLTLTVAYFGFLLGLGVLLAGFLKKKKIPDTFFLILLGLMLGPTLYQYVISYNINLALVNVEIMGMVPNFLRLLALIFVVFTGTFNLGFRVFKRFSDVSFNLAFFGVIFNTIVLGIVAHLLFGFELIHSFLMSAVISGTCSSVVFAFENTLKGSKKALNILKIESIFNTPFSVLFPLIFLGLVAAEPGALFEPMKYISDLWLMIAAGVGTGIILGLAISKLLKSVLKEYTALMFFAIAIITYALAEMVGGSGILAVAVCGLIAGDFVISGKKEIKKFDDHLTEMLRISVFTLLGAEAMLLMSADMLIMAFVFFLLVFFIRPVFMIPLLGKNRKDMSRRDIALLSFVTPRGLSAAATVPIVAGALLNAGTLDTVVKSMYNVILLVIILSILFSSLIAVFMGRLGPARPKLKKQKDVLSKVESETEKEEIEGEEEILEGVEKQMR